MNPSTQRASRLFKTVLACAVIGTASWAAQAQTWPTAKPITFTVAFGPGSSTDIVARTLGQHAQRPLDMLARYGGEEFVGLWVGASQAAMLELAECIRADVEALALPHAQAGGAQVVTLSIGVAYWPSPQVNGLEEAQRLADEALYAAKAAGRNRVVVRLGQP